MSETVVSFAVVPDLCPVLPSDLADVEPALRLHAVERLLEEGDLAGAVGQLRAARVAVERRDYPSYGDGLPDGWFAGEGFDVELALARMATRACRSAGWPDVGS